MSVSACANTMYNGTVHSRCMSVSACAITMYNGTVHSRCMSVSTCAITMYNGTKQLLLSDDRTPLAFVKLRITENLKLCYCEAALCMWCLLWFLAPPKLSVLFIWLLFLYTQQHTKQLRVRCHVFPLSKSKNFLCPHMNSAQHWNTHISLTMESLPLTKVWIQPPRLPRRSSM